MVAQMVYDGCEGLMGLHRRLTVIQVAIDGLLQGANRDRGG